MKCRQQTVAEDEKVLNPENKRSETIKPRQAASRLAKASAPDNGASGEAAKDAESGEAGSDPKEAEEAGGKDIEDPSPAVEKPKKRKKNKKAPPTSTPIVYEDPPVWDEANSKPENEIYALSCFGELFHPRIRVCGWHC